jgi:hypothetical protein
MNETEWLDSADPKTMLKFLGRTADSRRLRLFAVACCRRIWHLLPNEYCRDLVEAAERDADGLPSHYVRRWDSNAALLNDLAMDAVIWCQRKLMTLAEQTAAVEAWHEAPSDQWYPPPLSALHEPTDKEIQKAALEVAQRSSEAAARAAARGTAKESSLLQFGRPYRAERQVQAAVVRDIFGNPFQHGEIDPAWLTNDVVSQARTIYDDRSFDRLPRLADALNDAGCDRTDILTHCRNAGEHVRGCWVVDALLGKRRGA